MLPQAVVLGFAAPSRTYRERPRSAVEVVACFLPPHPCHYRAVRPFDRQPQCQRSPSQRSTTRFRVMYCLALVGVPVADATSCAQILPRDDFRLTTLRRLATVTAVRSRIWRISCSRLPSSCIFLAVPQVQFQCCFFGHSHQHHCRAELVFPRHTNYCYHPEKKGLG